jgi:hypothetical protein
LLRSAVFLEQTLKVYDLEYADANTPRLWVPKSRAWLILACQIFDVEDTCHISSGMVVVGVYDAHQERAVVMRLGSRSRDERSQR